MRGLALLLLCGCGRPDPYTLAESGGTIHLFDCADDAFDVSDRISRADYVSPGPDLLSKMPAEHPWRRGEAGWIGEQMLALLLQRQKRGPEPIRSFERFSVSAGREMSFAQDGFSLSFTVQSSPAEERIVKYRFAWDGQPPVEGRMTMPERAGLGFLSELGSGRWRVLVLRVAP